MSEGVGKLRNRRALPAVVVSVMVLALVAFAVRPAASAGFTRGNGYWLATTSAAVFAFGDATVYARAGGGQVRDQIAGMAARPTGQGYWLAARDGSVYAYGDAPQLGSASKKSFKGQITGIAVTPSGGGYWLASSRGGVLRFGDAAAYGSLVPPCNPRWDREGDGDDGDCGRDDGEDPSTRIVDIAATPSGHGYVLLSANGAVSAFGDAVARGSMPRRQGNAVAIALMSKGDGYWIASDRGGVFAFGAARSFGGLSVNGRGDDEDSRRIIDIAPTISGNGYWLASSDGAVSRFGDAASYGGLPRARAAIIAIVTTPFVNHAPVAAPDSAALDEDTTVDVNVRANDTDLDGDPFTATIEAGPAHGAAAVNANGTIRYAPAGNYNGPDSFSYRITDPFGLFAVGTVTLAVRPVNDAPVAADDGYTINEDATLNVAPPGVRVNDTDVDNDTLSVRMTVGPQHGTLTLGADGAITYVPTANYNGADGFTYEASDGNGGTATAVVRVTVVPVPDPPIAAPDAYTTDEDIALDVIAAGGLLANDTDADGDVLSAVLVTGPAHGALTLAPNGGFHYLGTKDYNGPDSFSYRANDGGLDSGVVVVELTVKPVNDPPVAAADVASLDEDAFVDVDVRANDADVDLDALTTSVESAPAHGLVTINANGSVHYAPAADYNGPDSFSYRVTDPSGEFASAAVTVTVRPVNDAPVAAADTATLDEDTPTDIAVLANDRDVDLDPLTVTVETGPTHGTVMVNVNGTIRYAPAADYNGTDSFVYRVTDPAGLLATATASLTVTPVNDAPVAAVEAYEAKEDVLLTVTAAAGLLANDQDVDHDGLTAVLFSGPAHGTLALSADGSFTYVGVKDYNGTDAFVYRAFDGQLYSAGTSVNLKLQAINDAPVANADEFSGREDTSLSGSVLTNDQDVDGDALTVALERAPQHGVLTLATDGTFSYVPAADFNGTDGFTYALNDGQLSATATVVIPVAAVADAPRPQPDDFVIAEDTALELELPGVLRNDTDPDGDTITAVSWTNPMHGTLTPLTSGNGGFRYVPDANFNGTDTFTYVATDGRLSSEPALVTVAIGPVNDAPSASSHLHTTTEDTALTVDAATGLLSGAIDVDGDALVAKVTFFPLHGTLDYGEDGTLTYLPDLNFSGTDEFQFRVGDGEAWSDIAFVTIDVTPVNDPPTAGDDSYTMTAGGTLTVAAPGILANDLDDSGAGLTAVLGTGVANGTLTLNANGSFTYTTTLTTAGTDSFTYSASDGTVTGALATVTIHINAPVSGGGGGGTGGGTTPGSFGGFVAPTIAVFDFDSFDTRTSTAVALGSLPKHGKLVARFGSWYYYPVVGYRGSDTFSIGGRVFRVDVLSSMQGDY
jgi:VCBS repeat-containing protein